MPEQYFDYSNYLVNYATFEDDDQVLPKTTVVCAVQIGNPDEVYVYEHDSTFNSTADQDLMFTEANSASKKDE